LKAGIKNYNGDRGGRGKKEWGGGKTTGKPHDETKHPNGSRVRKTEGSQRLINKEQKDSGLKVGQLISDRQGSKKRKPKNCGGGWSGGRGQGLRGDDKKIEKEDQKSIL